MQALLLSTLLKLGLPALTVLLVLVASRKHGISWNEDLGFRTPSIGIAAVWLIAWSIWIATGEVLTRSYGLEQAEPWPPYPAVIIVLRILAIGIIGPLSEELLMRGLVMHLLRRTFLGAWGAIIIAALAWAAMHYSYGYGTMALVAADGVLLGLARYKSGSIWIPVGMHVLGNLFSIAQSLTG